VAGREQIFYKICKENEDKSTTVGMFCWTHKISLVSTSGKEMSKPNGHPFG